MYVCCPADEVLWVRFGEDFIAFHRPSGKTHFLNAASNYLLTDLLDQPRNLAEIVTAFASAGLHDDEEALCSEISLMLDHLVGLGLVDRL